MKADEFFTQEWGTGFTKATLYEKNGLLEMSMEDIYSTMEKYAEYKAENLPIHNVSHSITGDGMNCLEFFDMIKKEWCISEEQYKPFWNDVLTFARKYHKERNEYCG